MLLDSFSSKSQSQDLAPQPDFSKTIVICRRNVEVLLCALESKALPKRANRLLLLLCILLRQRHAVALATALHARDHRPHRALRSTHLPQLADAHHKLARLVHRAAQHGEPRPRRPQPRHLTLHQRAQPVTLPRRHRDHRGRRRAALARSVDRDERPLAVLRQRQEVQLARLRAFRVAGRVRRPQLPAVELPGAQRRRVVCLQEAVRQCVELRGVGSVGRREDAGRG